MSEAKHDAVARDVGALRALSGSLSTRPAVPPSEAVIDPTRPRSGGDLGGQHCP